MIFKFTADTAGAHVHVQLRAGKNEFSLGLCGEFCMREEEWRSFREVLRRGTGDGGKVLVDENPKS